MDATLKYAFKPDLDMDVKIKLHVDITIATSCMGKLSMMFFEQCRIQTYKRIEFPIFKYAQYVIKLNTVFENFSMLRIYTLIAKVHPLMVL